MFLDLRAIADRLDLAYSTVLGYHGAAERRRRKDRARPGDFPPPDDRFGQSPVWYKHTIDHWSAHRPGRGAGGGRPWKDHRS